MNLSTNWLTEYVAHGLAPEALADLLTMAGLEVDGIASTAPDLDGVVVGHVTDVRPHPNADRLRVCDVDLGPAHNGPDGDPVQIVCGAPNVAAGQTVPVATVGTTLMLPARDGSGLAPVTIKKGKIRGEVSFGMICAEDEIGLGDGHDGILVLEDAPPGQPFADYLRAHDALPGDAVLDMEVTPNRPDATSHIGVARDVAALTGTDLTLPAVDVPGVGGEAAEAAAVHIEDPQGCPRYVAMVVRGVTVGPSPEWLQTRLEAVGVRPINTVVDVTNYVLHESGQPLHAFDLGTLADATIVVRASKPGETITTLDDQERKLPEGTLLICDANKPVAVAGVMGGANSEVSDATTDVLIESAFFDPSRIRKAAKALGMQTDASYRFERGVDPTGQARAAARAAQMLAELAGGTVVPGLIDENPVPYEARTVALRPARVAALLGVEIATGETIRLLEAIGFGAVDRGDGEALEVTVPPFRPDVEREVDVIEEVARLWGYDNLPTPATTPVPLVPATDTPEARLLGRVRTRLAALGFRELYTNSLVRKTTAEAFADAAWTGHTGAPVETLNPISQEMAALRPSLLPGMLAVASYNQARGAGALRLFEAGHVYRQADGDGGLVEGYHEHTSLAIGIGGEIPGSWDGPARALDFYDLKGVVTTLLADLGIDGIHETPHPAPEGLTAYALELSVGTIRLGRIGQVADDVADGVDLGGPFFVAELDWDALARLATADEPTAYRPISRFPVVERDLAVVVPEGQPAGPLLATIRTAGRPLLQDVRVFDVYRGEGLPEGSKSLAFALRFGADKTLRDKEVDGRVRRVVKLLEAEHQATLRG